MPVSNRDRFEVLKRDGFACQYCGLRAPSVALHVDHIEPVSKGGRNELGNYITSCVRCNLSKAATPVLPPSGCFYCREENGGIFFEVKGNQELVCAECIKISVSWLYHALRPGRIPCCACGEWFDVPDDYAFDPTDLVSGGWAFVCLECQVEYEWPAPRVWEGSKSEQGIGEHVRG